MAITKEKKGQIVGERKDEAKDSSVLLFADFKGVKVDEMRELRTALREIGATFRVVKKRLLKIVLKDSGIDFDPSGLEGQIGVAFAKGDISEIAQPVFKFAKEHETFKVVGGVDVDDKKEIPLDTIIAIGNLPSRDVLLASVVGSIVAPLRGLMYILNEKSKG